MEIVKNYRVNRIREVIEKFRRNLVLELNRKSNLHEL